ncbi:exosortase A [Rheinheimera maricola]|uniref:Exosortase n=1 Tax=Rheinheimera maricola TaxID=2793282 RepID=A0ABS7X857_9GAMM|nr:exosortase A [Rheinheimera maricola]MBZ9611722.1 exosortase [Rheinheimera maricola]
MTPFRSISSAVLLLLVSLAYVWLYGTTWLDMQRVWSSSATYNHCFLIIPISLYFFVRGKHQPKCATVSDNWLWLAVVAILLLQLLWLAGFAADIALFMHLAAVMTLQAILWLLLGNDNSRKHLFAIAYLIFLVPFGDELSPMLQNITADLTVIMLQLVNVPVYREGLYLATPVGLFEVAEACSGLRFLIASLAISALFAYLHFNKLYKQIGFVAFMAVLSILANGVRAFMLVYIGEKTAMRFGFGADHYLYGWLFFGVVLLAGFWLGARFSDPALQLSQNLRQHFVLPRHTRVILAAAVVVVATLSVRFSLDIIAPPTNANTLALPVNGHAVEQSNWGISYQHSLAKNHLQDSSGIEYFAAYYRNKQQQGELINWDNLLFDKQLWQIQQRIAVEDGVILQLKSLPNQQRSLMYWYQVGEHKSVSNLATKVRQALHFLTDDQSGAYVFAVSLEGAASEQNISLLQTAAKKLTAVSTQYADISSAQHD